MAVFYHGTTRRRARLIRTNGFEPRPPSKRVWFARSRSIAERRARHKSSGGSAEKPEVLTCEIDIGSLAGLIGGGRVFHARGILSIRGPVPAAVLCDSPSDLRRSSFSVNLPDEPAGLARWINRLLELPAHRGVSRRHPGVRRLSGWIQSRVAANPNREISAAEVAEVASRWLPDFFDGVAVDPTHMRSLRYRGSAAGDLSTLIPHTKAASGSASDEADEDVEAEALVCLASHKPRRRVRGLRLLTSIEAPADLVEWCLMLVDDEDVDVSVSALQTLAAHCERVNPFLVEDLAADGDRRLRAAALEVLAVHNREGCSRWLWEGLSDPEVHVRMALVRHLDRLDPAQHPHIFETALTDSNQEIVKLARRRSEGRGIGVPTW
ncbi:MAG TPA: HEAT repeat domain-containing protein [Candidatus Latescibacteria bacterium]|nr:hypothetical protein [Gemmatimonadaceae bacterium]MDP6018179.1 HEAT repeat domain-containing protein [Candidatus Latescibacterota bacterium]HJP33611.1 HEAT repeat domain-containing protein [Candidatus Latescibacterota bacterium]